MSDPIAVLDREADAIVAEAATALERSQQKHYAEAGPDAVRDRRFKDALVAASPDFQTEHGYPSDKDTKVNLSLASKYVGHTIGGLALTLEMPIKDNANQPDPVAGWSGARSRRLGAAARVARPAGVAGGGPGPPPARRDRGSRSWAAIPRAGGCTLSP